MGIASPLPAPAGVRSRGTLAIVIGSVLAGLVAVLVVAAAARTPGQLTAADAVVLGVVEGVTEYLPVSSTGHLTVTQRLLGIGDSEADKRAADAYAICIQFGAILAVLLLYRQRVFSMANGLLGRDADGRRLAAATFAAFAPVIVIALALEGFIKDNLFGVGPVVLAWAVGGVAILVLGKRWVGGRRTLDQLTVRDGLIIGLAQSIAMWPGVSRSLVTILAALALGLAVPAAVEFSFLLGLLTLGSATIYEALSDGSTIIDTFGIVNPLIGLVAALVSAVIAVRWMVAYLGRNGFALFGWYRLGIAAVVGVLLLAGVV